MTTGKFQHDAVRRARREHGDVVGRAQLLAEHAGCVVVPGRDHEWDRGRAQPAGLGRDEEGAVVVASGSVEEIAGDDDERDLLGDCKVDQVRERPARRTSQLLAGAPG